MARTGRKGAVVWLPISFPRRGSARDAGFSLLEGVCVLAIVAMLAAIAAPRITRSTSRVQLEAYAASVAALLKADRFAALRRRLPFATEIDASARIVRSGATGQTVEIPRDVVVESHLAARCQQHERDPNIRFFASGMSCGGVITFKLSQFWTSVRVHCVHAGIHNITS